MAERARASASYKPSTRTSKILALIPKSGPGSDIEKSGSSEDELHYAREIVRNRIIEDSDVSSDPPSLPSSLENLHILSDSDENITFTTTVHSSRIDLDINSPYQLPTTYISGSDSPSILSSVTNPAVSDTKLGSSFNFSQFPPIAGPSNSNIVSPSCATRSKKKAAAVVVKKKLVRVKRIDTKWVCKKTFAGRADIEDKIFSPPPPLVLLQSKSPLEYFQMFFDDDLIELMVQETNLYYVQTKGTTLNVTTDEIRDFIAIHLLMGLVNMPAYTDYWSKKLRYNKIAEIMPLKRYQQIRRYLHFANNLLDDGDRYYKVRQVLESVRRNCLKVEEETRFSIDEMMVPYKGTRAGSRKQYIKNKPRKWGFKIFVRAGVSGIVYDFLIYGGEDTFRYHVFSEKENGMGLGAKVVLALSKTIKQQACSVLYFDNFFTSMELLEHLRNVYGIFALGTIRQNRLRGAAAKLPTDKNLKKRGRGSFAQVVSNECKIAVVKWFDNKCVTTASTYTDSQPVHHVLRYCKNTKSRAPVTCPNIVKEYNCCMGGVDVADMLVALYRTEMRAHRWYIPLYSQVLDICVNNAWLMYRRETKDTKRMKLKDFRYAISNDLITFQRTKEIANTSRGAHFVTPRTSDYSRFDQIGHMPSFTNKGRCKNCIKSQTKFTCVKCNVRLCLVEGRNCFSNYHTKSA